SERLLAWVRKQPVDSILAPKLTMYSGQTADVSMLEQRSYVADYDVVEGKYDPVIRSILTGAALNLFVLRQPAGLNSNSIVLMRQTTQHLLDLHTSKLSTNVNNVFVDFPIEIPCVRLVESMVGAQVPAEGTFIYCILPESVTQKFSREKLPVVGSISDSI